MKKQPVDLQKVRKDIQEIEQILTEHPEIRERTRAYLQGELEEGDSIMANETQVTIRLPQVILDEAENLVEIIGQDIDVSAIADVSRSTVLRMALAEGLKVLKRKYRGGTHKASSPAKRRG